MNLVDKLLKMDAKKAEELQTGSVESALDGRTNGFRLKK